MSWEIRLTAMYVIISDVVVKYKYELLRTKIKKKYKQKKLTDVEVLTITLFGMMQGFREDKGIYHHIRTYLHLCFNGLTSYSDFRACP